MATPSLAIAKAAFTAAFIRPDPTSTPREQVNEWLALLHTALERCSRTNIQQCKQWLFAYAISSNAKVAAVGKYLVTLSGSLEADSKRDVSSKDSQTKSVAPRRKQLHILYLINDVLHHAKHHRQDASLEMFTDRLRKPLLEVLTHAAAYERGAFPKHHERLSVLVKLWQKHAYFDAAFNRDLSKAVADPSAVVLEPITPVPVPGAARGQRSEVPFEMPSVHGDSDAPYYDLPAANMMPHIVPNSKTPIDPRQMKALQFQSGPADPQLVAVVRSFLKDADMIYGIPVEEDQGLSFRLDELGQTLFVDKLTGDVIGGESYYGWSKKFCERMKSKTTGGKEDSRSRSNSRENSPRNRMRSVSTGRSRSRSRERSSRRYRSRDRSRSRSGQREYYRPRSRSHSPSHRHQYDSRSLAERGQAHRSNGAPGGQVPAQLNPWVTHDAPPPPFPFPFPGGIPLGPDGMPIPPPRPPNYTGPWPPPPPPPPPPAGSPPMPYPGFMPPANNNGSTGRQSWPSNSSARFHQGQGNR